MNYENNHGKFDTSLRGHHDQDSLYCMAMIVYENETSEDSPSNEYAAPHAHFQTNDEWELSFIQLFDISNADATENTNFCPNGYEDAPDQKRYSSGLDSINHGSFTDLQQDLDSDPGLVITSQMPPTTPVPTFPKVQNLPLDTMDKGIINHGHFMHKDIESFRFHPYHEGLWKAKYAELCEYHKCMGHSNVPYSYEGDRSLARWVKRQRYQYKLLQEGKPSTMTLERVFMLESIGFVWNSQHQAWKDRLAELEAFRRSFGHSNVPSTYKANPRLGTWVKFQRRQYRRFMEGKPCNITVNRILDLESVGFAWDVRVGVVHRSDHM